MTDQNAQQLKPDEFKRTHQFCFITLIFLIISVIIAWIAAYTEIQGVDFFAWKWYWYLVLGAGVMFILGVASVIAPNVIIWMAYKTKNWAYNQKNRSENPEALTKKLTKKLTEFDEQLEKIKEYNSKYELH